MVDLANAHCVHFQTKRRANSCFPYAFQQENIQSNNTGVDAIFSNLSKVAKFILINFNDDCAFFTEDASSLKKLSIELPSKIFLLNPTTKPVAYSKSE